jgi:hypothetical protein
MVQKPLIGFRAFQGFFFLRGLGDEWIHHSTTNTGNLCGSIIGLEVKSGSATKTNAFFYDLFMQF